jgi:uncharacterized protein (DUF433 family)
MPVALLQLGIGLLLFRQNDFVLLSLRKQGKMNKNNLLDRITIVPGLMGGKPTIRAMRFPVADILEMLSSGMTNEDILEEHPVLEIDDINAALMYAAQSINKSVIVHAA